MTFDRTSADIKIETGSKPLAERLSIVAKPVSDGAHVPLIPPTPVVETVPLDNLQALAVLLKMLSGNIGNMLNAATFCERAPHRIQAVTMENFGKDRETAQLVLRQLEESSERIAAIHRAIRATQV